MAEQQIAPHRIDDRLLQGPVSILVVGCGGTGAAFASGLPYLHQTMRALGHPGGLQVTVADGDVVAPSNRVRQPFNRHYVGRKKAEVLVTGLNLYWGLAWSALPRNITADDRLDAFDIVVGCVDTRAARAMLARATRDARNVRYWLDGGNGKDFGQVVLGEPHASSLEALRLPTVDELLPGTVRPGREENRPSCSEMESITRQAPFTNHVIASHMLSLLGQLFTVGQLAHHGMFLNLARGTVEPIPVDPVQWKVMMNVPAEPARGTRRMRQPRRGDLAALPAAA
jgi:sulfur-carrier protein adenylyltransferase/sulfurtransferase